MSGIWNHNKGEKKRLRKGVVVREEDMAAQRIERGLIMAGVFSPLR